MPVRPVPIGEGTGRTLMSAADGGEGADQRTRVQEVGGPLVVDLDDGQGEFGFAGGRGAVEPARASTRSVLTRLICCRTTFRSGLVVGAWSGCPVQRR
ncbi:hypothetical protein TN53_25935 [Streptomyces sp. WM6386]|nr:hypothetical protein TN53_25935 [Streptomyces sp. WM6386]